MNAPRYPVWLGLASFVWAVAGWVLAASAPHLAFVPGVEVLHLILPGITAALILANLAFSLNALFRHKVPIERLLLVTGLQIGLFTTLFFQFAAHLGADHYSIQRPTRSWEWVQFSVAHAIRAADVLDAIEAYGWDIQVIKHRGPFVASVVVLYHIVIDLFMLGLFWAMTKRIKKRLLEKPIRVALVFLLGAIAFLIWFGVWFAFAMDLRPWRRVDVPLWFAENVVRVVDFADVMDSFDIHWHQVPSGPLESTLTFFCRLWIAIAISLFLNCLKWRPARHRDEPPAVAMSPWGLSRLGIAVVLIAAMIGADSLLEAGTPERIAELTAAATGDDDAHALQALAAIRRLGPNARDAVGPLVEARERHPDRATKIVETLGQLGPTALDPLRDIAASGKGVEVEAAAASLRWVGPKAAPVLASVWAEARTRSVKAAAEAGLRELGVDAMPALIEATDKANSATHLHWFNELDRNWPLRGSENRTFLALKRLQRSNESEEEHEYTLRTRRHDVRAAPLPTATALENTFAGGEFPAWIRDSGSAALPVIVKALSNKNEKVRRAATEALGASGAPPNEVVPGLIKALKDRDVMVRRAATEALGEVGPAAKEAVPALVHALTDKYLRVSNLGEQDLIVHRLAAGALGKIGSGAGRAEDALIKALADEDEGLRSEAARALGAIGGSRRGAVPALSKALTDTNGEVRRAAAVALGMLGRDARGALPELTKLSTDDTIIGAAEARNAIGRIRGE